MTGRIPLISPAAAAILVACGSSFSSELLWTAFYDGGEGSYDSACDIAVDNMGNVYIVGQSFDPPFASDIITVKFDPLGQQQWAAVYNGPGNGSDVPSGIAVDQVGNVFVTGYSMGDGTNNDYVTIKYGTLGTEEWVARYNGSSNGNDQAFGLAVDPGGNVFVTGRSYGSSSSYDFATVRYDPLGQLEWLALLDGPAGDVDTATEIALDQEGNVIVAGSVSNTSIYYSDFAVVKYSPFGDELWTSFYDGTGSMNDIPVALAVDASGGILVSGGSAGDGTAVDFATLKYGPGGQLQWVSRYNSSGANFDDCPCAMITDPSSNVYVTGSSFSPVTGNDFLTVKYTCGGDLEWVRSYDGEAGWDQACGMAMNGAGDIFVTGSSTGPGEFLDILTIQYDDQGDTVWSHLFDCPAGGNDQAEAIRPGPCGRIAVAGTGLWTGDCSDCTVLCYGTESHSWDSCSQGMELPVSAVALPNPATEEVGIVLQCPPGSIALVSLIDVTGRLVREMEIARSEEGVFRFGTTALSSGVYFCLIRVDDLAAGTRFVLTD